MLNSPFKIKDSFGQSYLLGRGILKRNLKTIHTPFNQRGIGFLKNLKQTPIFWRQVLQKYGSVSSIHTLTDHDIMLNVTHLFTQNTLHIYPVPPLALTPKTHHRIFRHSKNHQYYQFSFLPLPTHAKLQHPKQFQNISDANEFVEKLNLKPESISLLCEEFELVNPSQQYSKSEQSHALEKALLNSDIIVSLKPENTHYKIQDTKKNIFKKSKILKTKSSEQQPSLLLPNILTPNSNLLCQRTSLTLTCSHGRSITLNAATKHIPTLEIIASNPNTKKPDRISLTSDIIEICEKHKHSHATVSCDKIKATMIERGKRIEFDAYSLNLNIHLNPLKYAWLPNIKPKIYHIYPGNTCDDSQLKNAGNSLALNVYPKLSWDWKVNIGYGTDAHTLAENENSKGNYKRALASKRLGITGHIKLTQDDKSPVELSSEFKQAIESTVQQIDAITGLVDSVIGEFDQGKKPKVTVTWPNLSLNLKTEIIEGAGNYREIGFDFGISAAPFFGLDVEVDILPIIAKPLDGGTISKWLIEEAQASIKKGIGKEDGIAFLQGEVSVIMKGKGALGFETHFKGDFSNNTSNIKKITGKPVTGKIEFSAEGKIDVKGHVLQVKVELVAGIGIKSGITLGMLIDQDDKGYYWQPEVKFNGLRVYVTRYIKLKENMGITNNFFTLKKKANIKQNTITEYLWIAENNLSTGKFYFINY